MLQNKLAPCTSLAASGVASFEPRLSKRGDDGYNATVRFPVKHHPHATILAGYVIFSIQAVSLPLPLYLFLIEPVSYVGVGCHDAASSVCFS